MITTIIRTSSMFSNKTAPKLIMHKLIYLQHGVPLNAGIQKGKIPASRSP